MRAAPAVIVGLFDSDVRHRVTLRPTSRGKIIGEDQRIRDVLRAIDRVARSSCTVLVTGESGTGKELVVAALHDASARCDAPLVTIDCGAIPVDLVEAELFGHARGAFTGAEVARKGLVAAAEGGTLFLDEVGELPLSAQVKLLRLLQHREYTPVGESQTKRCDIRIVAATNRDLGVEVAAGRFREDLYYRLDVIHLHLPPLRERRGDVRLLAEHFFRVAAEAAGRHDLRGLSPAALQAIDEDEWLGNVRALGNAIERGVLLAPGPFVEAADVLGRRGARSATFRLEAQAMREPPMVAPTGSELDAAAVEDATSPFPSVLPDSGFDLFDAAGSYQSNLIRQALERTGGNKNRAAQLLGVNRTTLVEIIRRRGIA